MIILTITDPFWLLNLIVFLLLLARPQSRRFFDGGAAVTWPRWTMRQMLIVCTLAPPVLTADYFIPQQRILREKMWEAEKDRISTDLVDQFINAIQLSDSLAADRALERLLNVGRNRLGWKNFSFACEALQAKIAHPNERIRLAIIEALTSIKVQSDTLSYKSYCFVPYKLLQARLDDASETESVHRALIDFLAEKTVGQDIRIMQDPDNGDGTRMDAASEVCEEASWQWGGRVNLNRSREFLKLEYLKEMLLARDPYGVNTVPPLVALLGEHHYYDYQSDMIHLQRRRNVLELLALLGQRTKPVVDAVRACLSYVEQLVRTDAAALLVQWRTDDERLVPILSEGVNYRPGAPYDPEITRQSRLTAIRALADLESQDPKAARELAKAARDSNTEISAAARRALAKIASNKRLPNN